MIVLSMPEYAHHSLPRRMSHLIVDSFRTSRPDEASSLFLTLRSFSRSIDYPLLLVYIKNQLSSMTSGQRFHHSKLYYL